MPHELAPQHNAFVDPGFGLSQRQEPRCDEIEMGVLGAILLNEKAFPAVAEFLKAEHFVVTMHQELYTFLAHEIQADHKITPHLLLARLRGSSLLNDGGGPGYIQKLFSMCPSPNIELVIPAARQIVDAWRAREAISINSTALDGLFGADPTADVNKVIAQQIEALMALVGISSRDHRSIQAADAAETAMATADAKLRGEITGGMTTGIAPIDKLMGELLPSCLYLLGGRPGMGKTSLAEQMVIGAARCLRAELEASTALFTGAGGRVLFFTLEMSPEQIGGAMSCQIGQLDNEVLKGKRSLSPQEAATWCASQRELKNLDIEVIDGCGMKMSIEQICMMSRARSAVGNVRLIVIDHVQKIVQNQDPRADRTSATTNITSMLKDLARSLKVPVLALAQLGRKVEDRENPRPQLGDLMYGGETDADVAAFLFREEIYLKRQKPQKSDKESAENFQKRKDSWNNRYRTSVGRVEFIVDKSRMGAPDSVIIGFRGETTSFYEFGTPVASNIGPEDADGLPF